jgi:tetratricopeptide (TPR) repeat protein
MMMKIFSLFFIFAIALPLSAAPFIPASDTQILEQLPVKNSESNKELKILKTSLAQNPNDLSLALKTARQYIETGRRESDPRYAGYAQAALAPWWNRADAPLEVRILRATLAQSTHQFDTALTELNGVLKIDKTHPQAWLTRASILQVQGRYAEAMKSCHALTRITSPLIVHMCMTGIGSVSGFAQPSYQQLVEAQQQYGKAEPELNGWVLTQLAEMATRLSKIQEAEKHFRAALQSDADDSYLLAAYADFLLDQQREAEVIALLKDKTRADGLLLRYAEALTRAKNPQAKDFADKLQQRFASAALRGDRSHEREQARFALHVQSDAPAALRIAQENWRTQKEPADTRILLEAAAAAKDTKTISLLRDWMTKNNLQDSALEKILRAQS